MQAVQNVLQELRGVLLPVALEVLVQVAYCILDCEGIEGAIGFVVQVTD